jgi:hypothetical protein
MAKGIQEMQAPVQWFTPLTGVLLFLAACGAAPVTSASFQASGEASAAPLLRGSQWNLTGVSSAMFGDCPNFSQIGNGDFLAVVSREHGRFSRLGALIGWHYPSHGANRLRVAQVGVGTRGALSWADEHVLEGQEVAPDTGLVITRLKARDGRYAIVIEDAAWPGADDVAVRRVRVRNLGGRTLADHHVTLYTHFALSYTGLEDRLEYDAARAALVQRSRKESLALVVGTVGRPAGWQCGLPGVPVGPAEDAASDARDGVLNNSLRSGGKWPGVSGALQVALPDVLPGQEATADFFFAMAPAEDRALAALEAARARGFTQIRLSDEAKWRDWLGKATIPAMPGRDEAVFRRALIVMKQLLADSGAFMASPAVLSPAYKYTWLQDSTYAARALLEAGHSEAARQILTFLARVQKPDGDWYVTYNGDGTPFMLWEHGTEFMGGHFVAAAGEYVAATGDLAWARTQWPALARACAFMTRQIMPSGLLRECRDLWETYSDLSWTYTNGSFHGGLLAGADLARRLGNDVPAREWSAAADRIRSALLAHAVRDGAFVKGVQLRNLRPDTVIDANVLGLAYPFGVVAPGDPLAGRTLDAVESQLAVTGGGIKRWEGDLWYDAQGWPELSDWAAILRSRRGDRDKALAHHGLNTERAWTTGSLQLGEVFDGPRGRWSSAFPLGWAEAKYVLAALELYRPPARDRVQTRP